jgi:D-tyrosyl-tRNA(Tyr) deacylase
MRPSGFSQFSYAGQVRGLVQRVSSASVDVVTGESIERVGAIGAGLCVLIGVTHHDTAALADRLADKVWNLRVLDDAEGVMNRSLADRAAAGEPAELLVVSQFTLYGDTRRGRRPSWVEAARPEHAEPLVERVVARLRALGATVATGRFRTEMRVNLVNDGPVTLLVEV